MSMGLGFDCVGHSSACRLQSRTACTTLIPPAELECATLKPWRAGSNLGVQSVTDARLADDQPGDLRFGPKFLPQLTDENAQILQVFGVGWSPHGGEELAVGDDPTGAAHEHGQQFEFLRR